MAFENRRTIVIRGIPKPRSARLAKPPQLPENALGGRDAYRRLLLNLGIRANSFWETSTDRLPPDWSDKRASNDLPIAGEKPTSQD